MATKINFRFLISKCHRNISISAFSKMNEKENYFEGKDHAAAYKQFRGEMPEEIVHKIIDFLAVKYNPKECIGVDVGCGSGQSTLPLAPYLKQMIGIDSSEAQIKHVKDDDRRKNTIFKVGSAESFPLADQSVHLVCAMNAFHWFDIPAFFKEADRVLIPNGVLALCVGQRQLEIKGCEEKSKALFQQFSEDAADYFDKRVKLADNFYRDISLPYKDTVRSESTIVEEIVSVHHYMGRLKTLSGTAKFLKEKPKEAEKLLDEFQNNLMKYVNSAVSPEKTVVTLRRRYALLMGRKPSS